MEASAKPTDEIEFINQLIERGDSAALRAHLDSYHPADLADLLEQLPPENALIAFALLPDFQASEVLDESHALLRAELVEKVDDERLADLLDTLPMDDAAEFLDSLEEETAERLLELMEPDEAEEVREILSYEDNTAGRLMTRDVAALRRQWTVTQALDFLRALPETETLHYLYVVDVIGRLIGVVPIRNLVLAPADTLIDEIMIADVTSVPVDADQEEIAEIISRYDYTAVPVVGPDGTLLGVITVDDALDALIEEATEDIQRLGGSEPLDEPYFSASIWTVAQKRVVWLLLLFVASSLSGFVVRSFEPLLSAFLVLNTFIPLIVGTGGNAGSQTVATIIRGIATEEVRLNDLGAAWRREFLVGLLLGSMLGAVGFLMATVIWQQSVTIGLVIALALPAVVVWANTFATVIPIVAERIGIDPTVVSAPMITTVVDATGLLIYFTVAAYLLL